MLNKQTLTSLKQLFAEYPIQAAYLFGSSSRGQTGSLSDIDIAVLLKPSVLKSPNFSLELKLLSGLKQILNTETVDLTILNTASPVLKKEATLLGQEIYSQDQHTRFQFEQKTLQEYEDTRLLRQIFYRAMTDRINQNTFGNLLT